MEREKFDKFIEEAIAKIPPRFKRYLDNITFIAEDSPSKDTFKQTKVPALSSLLGIYHGVPFKHRGPFYGNISPDIIVIYQKPIENICSSEEEVRKKVKEVIIHEIGHYFGLSEAELKEIENL